jgi:H+/Cl- antiporter ClcA
MHGEEALVMICMFVGFFAMVFGIYYMRTKESLAMIEKGMNPKDKVNRPAPFRSLKFGLLLLGAGLGLFTAYMIDTFAINPGRYRNFDDDNLPALYFSLIGIGGGLGLVISYIVEKKYWYDKNGDS